MLVLQWPTVYQLGEDELHRAPRGGLNAQVEQPFFFQQQISNESTEVKNTSKGMDFEVLVEIADSDT